MCVCVRVSDLFQLINQLSSSSSLLLSMISKGKKEAMKMTVRSSILLVVWVAVVVQIPTVRSFDITKLLSQYPAFSSFSNYLAQTQLAGDVNNRQAITVLAVDNAGMAPVAGKGMDVIKKVLSLHVILDYFDVQKFQHLGDQTITVTTLFQTTGQADAMQGFLQITSLTTGAVTFVSFSDPKAPGATLIKSVVSQPYNISVVQVSTVIMPPAIVGDGNPNAPTPSWSSKPPSPGQSPPVVPVPVKSPVPVVSPAPVKSPVPVASPVPVYSPVPVVSPVPVTTPVPVKSPVPVVSPVPIATPVPVKSPVPVTSPVPVATPVPVVSPVPVATPVPVVSPVPVATPVPVASPVPVVSPVPVTTPVPVASPVPVVSPVPVTTPVPVVSPVPVKSPVPVVSPVPVPVPVATPSGGGGGGGEGASDAPGDNHPSGVAIFGVNRALSIVLTLICIYALSISTTAHT